jgi:hypothetical protein
MSTDVARNSGGMSIGDQKPYPHRTENSKDNVDYNYQHSSRSVY